MAGNASVDSRLGNRTRVLDCGARCERLFAILTNLLGVPNTQELEPLCNEFQSSD